MKSNKPGRPRTIDGKQVTIYLSKPILEYLGSNRSQKITRLVEDKMFGTAIYEGKTYQLTCDAFPSCRLFDGNGLNEKEGDHYTMEYAAWGKAANGDNVQIYWQFDEIKGQETENAGDYPWDDDHVTRVDIE